MKVRLILLAFLSLIIILIYGCGDSSTSPSETNYDGTYSGKTSDGKDISFNVSNKQVSGTTTIILKPVGAITNATVKVSFSGTITDGSMVCKLEAKGYSFTTDSYFRGKFSNGSFNGECFGASMIGSFDVNFQIVIVLGVGAFTWNAN